ncbi:hypothetical protein LguiA_016325 [Lonicera macranthoides]
MSSSPMKLPFILLLFTSSLLLQGTLGVIICENLPKEVCAFSVASSGKRCVLENFPTQDGRVEYQCRTSSVSVERMAEYIETDECVRACGVDRLSVGISSDALLDPESISKVCSPICYQNCPNIVDLYFNLAMGEGVYLPELCEKQKENPHRAIIELMSSGAADGPISSTEFFSSSSSVAAAPASSFAAAPTSV